MSSACLYWFEVLLEIVFSDKWQEKTIIKITVQKLAMSEMRHLTLQGMQSNGESVGACRMHRLKAS